MEQLPPPPVPPRPDLAPVEIEVPRRRRFPLWVTGVCVLLALSMGAVAIAPLFEGTEEQRGPGFLFLDRTDQGTPTRWDPCEPIHYVVNAELAPPGSIEDVHEAVRRVSAATGIAFDYEGTTDEEASISREVYQFDRYGDRWVPVLIAWVDPDDSDIPFERGDRVAAGVAVPRIAPTRLEDVYVSGWVAINADDPNPPGFSVPGQQGPVILHELGHLMGLGHVRAGGELMHPSGGGVVDFGPGDREGLRRLGAESGCIHVIEPIGP
ncbi:MAG TPA: hypothetical protein VFW51_06390 [Actinomycetota bacterium]|nr:hypothetical protein [Actinomycetota bacterium]